MKRATITGKDKITNVWYVEYKDAAGIARKPFRKLNDARLFAQGFNKGYQIAYEHITNQKN